MIESLPEVIAAITEKRKEIGDPRMDDYFCGRYRAKWNLTRHYLWDLHRPAEIFEIGVRAGYFARIMLAAAGSGATYTGIDSDTMGQLAHARGFLEGYDTQVVLGDSHDLTGLDRDYDLIHVDGDHSVEGCLADLRLVFPHARRAVIVDDYLGMASVREACSLFMAEIPGIRCYVDAGEMKRGSFVIEIEGGQI